MGKTFRQLWEELPPERQQKIEARYQERLKAEMSLQELRQAFELTQENVAKALQIHQVNVSKLENRSDVRVSTLEEYIGSLGGHLKLVAEFPGGLSVELAGFTTSHPTPSTSTPQPQPRGRQRKTAEAHSGTTVVKQPKPRKKAPTQ